MAIAKIKMKKNSIGISRGRQTRNGIIGKRKDCTQFKLGGNSFLLLIPCSNLEIRKPASQEILTKNLR